MKPSFAAVAGFVALGSTLAFAIQEKNNNSGAPASNQATQEQIEAALKDLKVFNKADKAEDGTVVYDLFIRQINVQLYMNPTTGGQPGTWRLSAGWDLTSAPKLVDVNAYNSVSDQAFCYLDAEGDPFLVLDQNIQAGSSGDILKGIVTSFDRALPEFDSMVLKGQASIGAKQR